jgi:hypothetical protein
MYLHGPLSIFRQRQISKEEMLAIWWPNGSKLEDRTSVVCFLTASCLFVQRFMINQENFFPKVFNQTLTHFFINMS